jgi:Tol biopolymer transport system component/predicted Ser/Thr protein kinase
VIGKWIGPYQILAELGRGGMGEVYRARDTRLNRDVALKVLPELLAGDPAARARFVREGQALGALSHPNLVAIFDVGTDGGTSFVVMELVDGDTLQALLAAGRLPMRRVLEYAAQVARGLAAAHNRGIVHRDLKPANVIVAANGVVKILDFGLARTESVPGAARASEAHTAVASDAGIVMGTVGYMAPEQVRGQPADARTDIFAFGVLLYEMAAGVRPFRGESPAETMTAIARDEAPPIAVEREVPPTLDRIIHRCLEKRPENRFQSAADLAFQLESMSSPTGRVEPSAAADTAHRPRRRPGTFVAAGVFLAGIAIGWAALARLIPPVTPPAPPVTRTTVLTYSGRDSLPAVSPDGKTIAFVSTRDGAGKIWLRQLATAEEAVLTEGNDTGPRFSPDGATLLFSRYEGASFALYRVPVVGGQPRKVLDQAFGGDWSPDGLRIAFVRQRQGTDWVAGVAGADGSQIRESQPLPTALRSPRWSPDGRSFVVVQSGIQATIADRLLVFDAGTLASTSIDPVDTGGQLSSAVWSGTDALVYAQVPDVTSYSPESRIVWHPRSGGGRTIAWVPANATGLDILADGSIVLDAAVTRQNLREGEVTPAGLVAGRWLTRGTSSDRQPAYSPDGKWIVFSAARSGNLDLYMTSPATGETRRLTDDKTEDWDPAITPDGKNLIWSSNRTGHFEIWIAEPDGRNARQLTKDGQDAENPTATPDGEWIVYSAGSEPTQGLWKIHRDGSQATRFVTGINSHPELSPDGQYVLYHSNAIGFGHVRIVRLSDGKAVIPEISVTTSGQTNFISVGRGRWRADGQAFIFVAADATGRACLYEQTFRPGQDTSATRRVILVSEPGTIIESFGFSPDRKHGAVSYVEGQFGLMRLDGLAEVKKPR